MESDDRDQGGQLKVQPPTVAWLQVYCATIGSLASEILYGEQEDMIRHVVGRAAEVADAATMLIVKRIADFKSNKPSDTPVPVARGASISHCSMVTSSVTRYDAKGPRQMTFVVEADAAVLKMCQEKLEDMVRVDAEQDATEARRRCGNGAQQFPLQPESEQVNPCEDSR